MKAIVIDHLGGADVLQLRDTPDPVPGPEDILVRIHVAGVNFMDTGVRRFGSAGLEVPFVPGVEGAGVVIGLGAAVADIAIGDRVAWVYAQASYAEQIVLPAERAVPIPDSISDETAAAVMMHGITAHNFVTDVYPVHAGDVTLVHAAAGGLGQMLTRMITAKGASVIGVVSKTEKIAAAKAAGAAHVIESTGNQFAATVMDLTDGAGTHAVFDGNGESTFQASLRSVRRNGTMLYYGPFIGDVPTISLRDLPNSIKLTYPTFRDHIATRQDLLRNTANLFALVELGVIQPTIANRYPLSRASAAHQDIESRATTGKLLLIPGPTLNGQAQIPVTS